MAIAGFGVLALALLGANLFWRSWWGPGTSTAIAWLAFAVHIAICRRVLNPFDPVAWTPAVMLLFYMGIPVAMNVFGYGTHDPWDIGEIPPKLTHGYAAALLSIVAFILGAHLAGFRNLARPPRRSAPDRSILLPSAALLFGGGGMALIGIAVVGAGILFGSYGEMRAAIQWGDVDSRLFGTGILFLQGGIFGMIASHDARRPLLTWMTIGITVLLALLLFRIGDRGGMSALMFGAGWVYSQRVRRVPGWIVITGFVFAFLLIPVIGEYREHGDVADSSRLTLRESFGAGFLEMGGGINSFCYSIDGIPKTKPYDLGATFANAVLDNIPRIAVVQRTERSKGLSVFEHLPTHWLTYYANPGKYFNTGAGYAYTMAAEWYFNFGIWGIAFGMVFVGWVTGIVRNRVHSSALWLTFSALYVSMMMLLVRNTFAWPFRTLAWPLVGLLFLRLVLPRIGSRKKAAARTDERAIA